MRRKAVKVGVLPAPQAEGWPEGSQRGCTQQQPGAGPCLSLSREEGVLSLSSSAGGAGWPRRCLGAGWAPETCPPASPPLWCFSGSCGAPPCHWPGVLAGQRVLSRRLAAQRCCCERGDTRALSNKVLRTRACSCLPGFLSPVPDLKISVGKHERHKPVASWSKKPNSVFFYAAWDVLQEQLR